MVKNINFSINTFIEELRENYKSWNSPVLSFISRRGKTPFNILISTILSLRTKDKVTIGAYDRLSKLASKPEEILNLSIDQISHAIYPVGFYRKKSNLIIKISRIVVEKYNGVIPNNIETLLTLPGVGRKTANLVLSEAFGIPSICVDTHVHRISNRTGYVKSKNPNETEFVLREQLPKQYWKSYNFLMVSFGQIICRPISPFCSKCPVRFMCPRVGVIKSR